MGSVVFELEAKIYSVSIRIWQVLCTVSLDLNRDFSRTFIITFILAPLVHTPITFLLMLGYYIKIWMFIFLILIQKLLIRFPKSQLILKACFVGKPTIPKASQIQIINTLKYCINKFGHFYVWLNCVKMCEFVQKWMLPLQDLVGFRKWYHFCPNYPTVRGGGFAPLTFWARDAPG